MNQKEDEEMCVELKRRARVLAKVPGQDDTPHSFLEVVEFHLAGEAYGIESDYVREICSLKELTPLFGVPAFVLGVTNVRGQILSVIDLKKFFNLPERGLSEMDKIIIVQKGQMEFGVFADSIQGTRRVIVVAMQEAPPTITGIGAEYLKGVTGDRMAVLNMEEILGDPRMIVDQSDK